MSQERRLSMVVELLVAAGIVYGLVAAPAQKYVLLNRAATPRDKTFTTRLADGTKVKLIASPFENEEEEVVIRFEVWEGDDRKLRAVTAAELELLSESSTWKTTRALGLPVTDEVRDNMIKLIENLRDEIKSRRGRLAKEV